MRKGSLIVVWASVTLSSSLINSKKSSGNASVIIEINSAVAKANRLNEGNV